MTNSTTSASSTEDVELDQMNTVCDTPDEWEHSPKNPRNWPVRRKWMVTGFSCFLSFMVGINALSIASAAGLINEEFDVSDANFPNSYWTVTAWNTGAMFGPVLGLPLMETYGIKTIYFTSFVVFTLFVIPQAVAQNYATLIVTRFFAGLFGSIIQNAVANIIGDLFVGETLPSTFFVYAYLVGFTFGPTFGSAIVQFLDWRWIFYIQLILYGVLILPTWLLIEETRGAIMLMAEQKSDDQPSEPVSSSASRPRPSFVRLLYDSTIRPLWLFCTEPVLFTFTIWIALAISNVFLATQSVAQTFGRDHGFGDVQAGYIEGALVVGETIGLAFSILQGYLYQRSASKNPDRPGVHVPESILTLSIPGSFIGVTGGLFIYAWTSYPDIPWIAPTIGLGIIGIGIQLVVCSGVTYVEESYGVYGGSAVAAIAFIENSFSAFLPLSAKSLYSTLGFQWSSTLLAFFALILSFGPVVLYLKGPQIRARSKFMTGL